MRFAAVTDGQAQTASAPAAAAFGPPRTFFEMVLFSVAVSVATQVVLRSLFKER